MPLPVPKTPLPPATDPYTKFLRDNWAYVGWVPGAAEEIEKLQSKLESADEPLDWLSLAASSMRQAWRSLPQELRGQALQKLGALARGALNDMADLGPELAQQLSGAAEVAPIIGDALAGLVNVIVDGVDYSNQLKEIKIEQSHSMRQFEEYFTVSQYEEPTAWVFHSMSNRLAPWYGTGGKWRLRPAFPWASTDADLMFRSIAGPEDQGNCKRLLDCPVFFDNSYPTRGCKYDGPGPNCVRYVGISALFYPYWSPAYAPMPIPVAKPDALNPNEILIARQTALLTSPAANLRIRRVDIEAIFSRFTNFWTQAAKSGLSKIDNDGLFIETPSNERLTIDPEKEENYAPTTQRRDKFFFQEDGTIGVYPALTLGDAADPSKWGVKALGDFGLGVSVAQYNAVVSGFRAFMAARANMIRNGAIMQGMLLDETEVSPGVWQKTTPIEVLDEDVQAAVQYAADTGTLLPSFAQVSGGYNGAGLAIPDGGGIGDIAIPPKKAEPEKTWLQRYGPWIGAGATAALIAWMTRRAIRRSNPDGAEPIVDYRVGLFHVRY